MHLSCVVKTVNIQAKTIICFDLLLICYFFYLCGFIVPLVPAGQTNGYLLLVFRHSHIHI
jgi:hypothetical protein